VIHTRRFWVVAAASVAVIMLVLSSAAVRPRCTRVVGSDQVSVPLASLAHGAINFFCYDDPAGARLRFILARDEDGRVHSVLDACHQCSVYHKGYTASKGDLICRLCGNRYRIRAMEKGQASCVPVSLPFRERNGVVEVKVSDLKQGRSLF
jgi:uncharacterized membrane protein